MLEKLFVAVKQNPMDADSVDAYLEALSSESNLKTQVGGISELARLFFSQNPLRAIDLLEVAFRKAPLNEEVIRAYISFLELRCESAAQEKMSAYLKKVISGQTASQIPVKNVGDGRSANASTRVQGQPPASHEFSKLDDENTTAIEAIEQKKVTHTGTKVAFMPNEAMLRSTAVNEPLAPSTTPAGAKESKDDKVLQNSEGQPYGIYRDFVRSCGLNVRVLEFAVEFADSTLGLIHFLKYLHSTQQIEKAQFTKAAGYMEKRVGDLKVQLRFEELIKPLL